MVPGWIRLHRKITENPLWEEKPFDKARAWIDMIFLANFRDSSFWVRNQEIKVKRGQLAWSELSLAERWGWSRNKVRRFMNWLKIEQQIEQQKNSLTSLTTITKYEEYQTGDTTNGTADDTAGDTTGETHKKEGKEGKEGKEKKVDKSPHPSCLFNLWNRVVREPRATVMNKSRETKCRQRMKERTADEWELVFQKIVASPFLQGGNDRGWRADFDWIISNDSNAVKVLEGKYDGTRHQLATAPLSKAQQRTQANIENARIAAERIIHGKQ